MLFLGTEMFLLIPSPSNEKVLHPGKVLQSDQATFTAEFEEPIAPPVDSDVNTYGAVNNKFFQQGAVVTEIIQAGPNAIIAFKRVGAPVSAENRQTFRVSVVTIGIQSVVDKEKSCHVVDLSPEGFGVIAAREYRRGALVPIAFHHEGLTIESAARVQTIKPRYDKKFRYGFLVSGKTNPAVKQLAQLSSAIQRQQLRRLAGVAA